MKNEIFIDFMKRVEENFEPYKQEFVLGRIVLEHKSQYKVMTIQGEWMCEISGKFHYLAGKVSDYPSVGDWVILKERKGEDKGLIEKILPRTSKFSRKKAGPETEEQIVAANIDDLIIVSSLNSDLNLRRIERYLILAWESGANPILVLSKSDLCEDVADKVDEVDAIAMGVPIIPISVKTGMGMKQLQEILKPGRTSALVGSSGVGKSTLINELLGAEKQIVQEIREDDNKGKHTTTFRELFFLDNGSCIIDTPGMREIQLWESQEGMASGFGDVESLFEQCKFRNCSHHKEPGCAVRQAIKDGDLTDERFQSYLKLQRELAYLDRKSDKKAQSEERKKWKKISQSANAPRR
ncbi:ribosome small subunit-dependent GTPase A [Falsibacillus albus]|uniref:Small ribosomal subunit biogenesis GTPase RsgA n=1 Tax=Falsibacillus albus TaxID=2478915 RepID=A0A3L7JWF3_9BACI|nr:ribosome small subunit-dependent GTPase A [Falsibacillus albus]RLQ95187.1 ribosome small subunit-dependent GTPase A [Falsibacillus albus]